MIAQGIDLFDPYLWGFVILGVALLGPLKSPDMRQYLFCALNLVFLTGLLGLSVFYILAALTVFWISLKYLKLISYLVLIAFLAIFVTRKVPELLDVDLTAETSGILAIMGFSYFFLRAIDLARAVLEGRNRCPNFFEFINYLVPFHMLAAGPIQAWDDFIVHREDKPGKTLEEVLPALERIGYGLFKKYVIAVIISRIFLTGFTSDGLYLLLEIQFFFIWLYLDFSAYTDIAVGVGRLMGVHTPENFNRPYAARNIIEFWERWHISLAQFVRRNVFIPVQLTMARRWPTHPLISATVAFTLAFLLLGLWHDISLIYLTWGGFHALGLVLCNLYRHWLKKKLGQDGMKKYHQNLAYRMAANFITFEFVAFSLYIVA